MERFEAAMHAHANRCAENPETWHCSNFVEFIELKKLLLPLAEAGVVHCQYALATIIWLGLCCQSEQEFVQGRDAAAQDATPWWLAAAKHGFWPATDNLVTSGFGSEAREAVKAWEQLESERPDLIGRSHGMPVYGPKFVQELTRRLYGKVITEV